MQCKCKCNAKYRLLKKKKIKIKIKNQGKPEGQKKKKQWDQYSGSLDQSISPSEIKKIKLLSNFEDLNNKCSCTRLS